MKLAFIYYTEENTLIKREMFRYKHLLKNYFEMDDPVLINKLKKVLGSMLQHCSGYEILSPEETEIYNLIIDFMANELNEEELYLVQKQFYSEDIKSRISKKMDTEISNVDPEILKSVMEKSNRMIEKGNIESVEMLFIPSVIILED